MQQTTQQNKGSNKMVIGVIVLEATLLMLIFGLVLVLNYQSQRDPAALAAQVQSQGITREQGQTALDLAQSSKAMNEGESAKLLALSQVWTVIGCFAVGLAVLGFVAVGAAILRSEVKH